MKVTCEWYAKCTNQTDKAASHPVLGPVPCCDRCADKHNLKRPYRLTPRSN